MLKRNWFSLVVLGVALLLGAATPARSASIALSTYGSPTADYLASTTLLDIPTDSEFMLVDSLEDSNRRVSFAQASGDLMMILSVPTFWASWGAPPYTETATRDALGAAIVHGVEQSTAGGEELTPEAILNGLKQGDFYSSTGPAIHDLVVVPGERLWVSCSPANRIFVIGGPARYAMRGEQGITEAEFDLRTWKDPYLRVLVRDDAARKAWTNPLWFDGSGPAG